MRIGIIYGSTGGATQEIATKIQKELNLDANLIDIADATKETFKEYERFIIGTSTWGDGELQDDWEDNVELFKEADLNGKTIAFFGVGDQESYYDTFVNAMGELYAIAKDNGAEIVGDDWPNEGYDFSESKALVNGCFVGLALDEDNQDDQTDERIKKWIENIKFYYQ